LPARNGKRRRPELSLHKLHGWHLCSWRHLELLGLSFGLLLRCRREHLYSMPAGHGERRRPELSLH
jgi:hypothetical protein